MVGTYCDKMLHVITCKNILWQVVKHSNMLVHNTTSWKMLWPVGACYHMLVNDVIKAETGWSTL